MVELARVICRPLTVDCPLNAFQCGEPIVDNWIRKKAQRKHAAFTTRVMTAHHEDDGSVLGLHALRLVLEPEKEIKAASDVRPWTANGYFPALHLEFLGVDLEHQNQGLGSFLLIEVILQFCDLAEITGVPVLTLTPLNSGLVPYYEKRNFVRYGTRGSMMMTAKTAMSARDTFGLGAGPQPV